MDNVGALDIGVDGADDLEAPPAAKCPFPHGQLTDPAAESAATDPEALCPIKINKSMVHRSQADLTVRRLLRIKDRPSAVSPASAQRAFQKSMLISGTRCTLTYVIFPFVAPAIGLAAGVGPLVGVLIGTLAMTCDVFTIRRFFAADHKWRWPFSIIALTVICFLSILWIQDVDHLAVQLLS